MSPALGASLFNDQLLFHDLLPVGKDEFKIIVKLCEYSHLRLLKSVLPRGYFTDYATISSS